MLCQRCQGMLKAIDNGKEEGRHYDRSSDLVAAAETGCYVCAIILETERKAKLVVGLAEDISLSWQLEGEGWTRKTLEYDITLRFSDIYTMFESAHTFRLEPEDSKDASFCEGYRVPISTSEHEVHRLAEVWLKDCLHGHDECARDRDAGFSPPRLIDLTGNQPRLALTTTMPSPVQYATLSHCWGPKPTFMTLTADNRDALLTTIPFKQLPMTFQHSIVFCRNIGVGYLWIDSLCIVQSGKSSQEDWLHHVSIMPAIYSNGVINIAAEWAESSERGLFKRRNPIGLSRPRYSFHNPWLEGRYQLVSYSGEHERELDSSASLRSRGWVAQERLLAPRIVRFGRDQIRWECYQSRNESERYPKGTNASRDVFSFPITTEHSHRRSRKLMTKLGHRHMARYNISPQASYKSVVEEYSGRNFTWPDSDKLAAFGAIARRFSEMLSGQYVAGFYESLLPSALVWVVQNPPADVTHSSKYRAPSWSWAKTDRRVQWADFCKDGACSTPRIKRIAVGFSDPGNPYGQLQSAELYMVARLFRCRWASKPRNGGDITAASLHCLIRDQVITVEGSGIYFDSRQYLSENLEDVRLCPVGYDAYWFSLPDLHFLILKEIKGSDNATYERIGATWLHGQGGFQIDATGEEEEIRLI